MPSWEVPREEADCRRHCAINCTLTGNSAAVAGGGMHNNFSFPIVINCTFTGNSAGNGGGMWNDVNSNPTVTDSTFTQNTADNGGAIFGDNGTFANCIVWDNNSGGGDEIDGTPTVTYSDVLGGFAGMGNINLNPLFVDTDTGDHHLSAGSPCIDAGLNIAVPAGTTTDLDGNPRFVDDLKPAGAGHLRRPTHRGHGGL